jgi:hypothetical protein
MVQGKEPFQENVGYGIKTAVVVHTTDNQAPGGFQLLVHRGHVILLNTPLAARTTHASGAWGNLHLRQSDDFMLQSAGLGHNIDHPLQIPLRLRAGMHC